MNRVAVTGAGGFIGNHLVSYLKGLGYWVRGVDIKIPEYPLPNRDEFKFTDANEFTFLDLRFPASCELAVKDVDEVYTLAADMGGMGYIYGNDSVILRNNLLIDLNMAHAAYVAGVKRILYTSTACVYPAHLQGTAIPLKEDTVFPASPQEGYSWEKVVGETIFNYFHQDYGLETHIVRLHNIFGPLGTWRGGREKVPAALCRKIAVAKLTHNPVIEIWGDGEQERSFCYVDDCVIGLHKVMQSSYREPLNIGQERIITINALADIIAEIAGIKIEKLYVPGPQGVRGRTSDNTNIRKVLNWEPEITLEEGLAQTYRWVEEQVKMTL